MVGWFRSYAAALVATAACACTIDHHGSLYAASAEDMTTDGGTNDDSSANPQMPTDSDGSQLIVDGGAEDATSRPVDSAMPGDDANTAFPTAGMILWLSADVGLTEVSDHVASWQDRSGNANDAMQPVDAFRPAVERIWKGGKPAVIFDGVAGRLELPAGFGNFNEGLSLFVVGDSADGSTCACFVSFSNGGEVDDISFQSNLNNNLLYEVSEETVASTDNVAPTNQPLLLDVIQPPGQPTRIFVGGTSVGSGSMMLPKEVLRKSNGIGRSSYPECPLLSGHIGEVIAYSRSLSDAERMTVEAYLRTSWSL